MTRPRSAHRVVVVGGGFTGAAYAIHRIRAASQPLALTIVEPAPSLGRGIAYGGGDPEHRINVPSERMSLFPDQPDHATRWFFDEGILPDPRCTDARGHHYVPRRAYGRYVGAVLRDTVDAAGARVGFVHRRARAEAVTRRTGGLDVALFEGGVLRADEVVLAFGHLPPAPPDLVDPAARAHPRLILDPWKAGAYDGIGQHDRVLVIGTGLTMADVTASLKARGHRGPITAVSRRGLLSQPHGTFASGLDVLGGDAIPRTALGLLRLLRRRVEEDRGRLGWAAWADALRFALPELWKALPDMEKRKAIHRLLPFWEVHRFRIAPQIHAALAAMRAEGRLTVERAALVGVEAEGGGLAAHLRLPGGGAARRIYDAVVLCTGPDKSLGRNPLVGALLAAGLARPDAVGLGLDVDRSSRLRDAGGATQPDLLALGPITRGTFGEMTGAPDILRHIVSVLADRVRARYAAA